jgi:hypothetical protein
MVDVVVAQFDRPMGERDSSAGDALGFAAETVADFKTAGMQRTLREGAADIAKQANQTRFAAEGLASAGSAAPLMDAAMGREEYLIARGSEISDGARRRFERYKHAVEQGASNKSAARIAVQKEMRDMIANNPVYADVIRQAAAEAMGEEEFLVLTRDLQVKERSETQSEFAKRLASADDVVATKAGLHGWSTERTEQYRRELYQQVTNIWDLEQKANMFGQAESVAGLETNFAMQTVRASNQIIADQYFQTASGMLQRGPGGLSINPEQVRNLTVQLQTQIQTITSQMNREMAGRYSSPTEFQQQLDAAIAPLRETLEFLQDNNLATRLGEMKTFLDNNAHVSMYELLPMWTTVTTVFGDNAEYVMRALERNDAITNEMVRNSPIFADLRVRNHNMSPMDMRWLVVRHMQNSVEAVMQGRTLSESERAGLRGYVGLPYSMPSEVRNKDATYANVIRELAPRGDPLVGSELARTNDLDEHQIAAARLWQRNMEASFGEAERMAAQWLKQNPEGDYEVVIQESAGVPVIVLRRYAAGQDFDATGKATPVLRPVAPMVFDAASEGYRALFQTYQVDNAGTRRRPLDNPVLMEALYGNTVTGPESIVESYLNRANAGRPSR